MYKPRLCIDYFEKLCDRFSMWGGGGGGGGTDSEENMPTYLD
jgi:hypothetical protein